MDFTSLRVMGAATVVAALLSVSGCSGSALPASSGNPDPDATFSRKDSTETPEASPRIVVGTETGVTVLDEHLHEVGAFTTKARPSLTVAHDGRRVLAVQSKSNTVQVVDAGSYARKHGNHYHYYTTAPAMAEKAIEGGKPVHVVPNVAAQTTAVFFDADGSAKLLDTKALDSGAYDAAPTVSTRGPQHGVVVPLPDGKRLVSQPGDEGTLPDTIELQDSAGTVSQTYQCADMHGEVAVGTTAAFGCGDSVLVVRDGKATVVSVPAGDDRVGGISADAKAENFVGDWGTTSLLFVTGDRASVVDIGVEYGNRAVTPDGGVVVLGTDGVLRRYDMTGKEQQRVTVTQPWTLPKGHGATMPNLAAGTLKGAPTVWVTEPAAGKVHAVDLTTSTVTSADVAGQPASLAVTNAR